MKYEQIRNLPDESFRRLMRVKGRELIAPIAWILVKMAKAKVIKGKGGQRDGILVSKEV